MWLPGYSGHDSILQVFIIVAFDIKALVVQLHEAFQHGLRAIQKVTFVHTVRAPVLLQLIIDFWCSVWCWKVASYSCTSALMSKATMMQIWRILSWLGWIARQPHGMTRVYTNWYQDTSALTPMATTWKSRERHVPQLVYSVSVLLLLLLLIRIFRYGETFITLWMPFIYIYYSKCEMEIRDSIIIIWSEIFSCFSAAWVDPGGPMVVILATGSEVCRFTPGWGRWIFSERKNSEYDFLRKESKAMGPML